MICPICNSELTFPIEQTSKGPVHAQCAVFAWRLSYPDPIIDEPDDASEPCDCNNLECVYYRKSKHPFT